MIEDEKLVEIKEFDPLTGEKTENLSIVKLYANSHYITPRPTVKQAIKEIKDELSIRIKTFTEEKKLLEAQRIEERTRFDLEMIEATGTCSGIENYSRISFLEEKEANHLLHYSNTCQIIALFL